MDVCNFLCLQVVSRVLLAVQNSVYGANHNEPGIGKKSANTPKKRPAPEDDPALKDALAQHDYKVLPSYNDHLQFDPAAVPEFSGICMQHNQTLEGRCLKNSRSQQGALLCLLPALCTSCV